MGVWPSGSVEDAAYTSERRSFAESFQGWITTRAKRVIPPGPRKLQVYCVSTA